MYILLSVIALLIAAVLQAYCEFGRQARPDVKQNIFKTPLKWLLEAFWVLLLLAGCAYIFFYHWIFGIIAIVVFWLILPFIITPIMRNRLLPPWDEVKSELEPKGYTQRDYWRGDWWMKKDKRRALKRKSK